MDIAADRAADAAFKTQTQTTYRNVILIFISLT